MAVDVEQYSAQCTTQNILICVPTCNTTTHGYELLATIDGTDTKFSCSLSDLLYSWVGAAALGGFLGSNAVAFISAVISGAAGTYVLTLTGDADVGTDLTIQPGQHVVISGDAGVSFVEDVTPPQAPKWGSGALVVLERGSLSLVHVAVQSKLSVMDGGSASLSGCTLAAGCTSAVSFSLMLSGVVSLRMTSMAVPAAELGAADGQLSGAGSSLRLSAVTVPDVPSVGRLTGVVMASEDNSVTTYPPILFDEVPGTRWYVDRVLIVGGYNLDSATLYDQSNDRHSPLPNMGTARSEFGAALLGALVCVVGGTGPLDTAECYDSATRAWTVTVSMGTARYRHAVASIGDTICAIGGWDASNTYLSSVECYGSTTRAWTEVASLITARKGHHAAAVGTVIYTMGGWDGSNLLSSVEARMTCAPPAAAGRR